MESCEYCEAEFSKEDALLEHMGEAHRGDLGPIDRRRVNAHAGGGEGISTATIAFAGLGVAVLALVLYVFVLSGGSGGGGVAAEPLPDQGDASVISQVQTEPAQRANHVAPGTDIEYATLPPTSGPHYPPGEETPAGFYTDPQPLGSTVHSLEHGAVVVWYDPAALTEEAESSLRTFAQQHQDRFGSFIAVPTPVENPEHPYVLTAWEHRLTMDEYDAETVQAFVAEYLGRGPEGQIR